MLNENEILAILNDWNFWRQDIAIGIRREKYLRIFSRHFPLKTAVSVVGLRRSGKSTLMLQFAKELLVQGKVFSSEILYVNFEEPRFLGNYSLNLLNIIYKVYRQSLCG